jgi:hypothetical protein
MTWRCAAPCALVALVLLALPASASAQCADVVGNVVVNCSFEAPAVADGSFSAFAPGSDLGGWTVPTSGDGVDLVTQDFFGSYPVADGRQALDLNHDTSGGIEQTIVTARGATYSISFKLSGYPAASANCPATAPQQLTLRLASFAQTFTFTPAAGASPPGNQQFVTHVVEYRAPVTSTPLRFTALNTGCAGPIIDDVSMVQTGTATPVLGRSMGALTQSGTVLVRRPRTGRFVRLRAGASLPVGTIVDARRGRVRIFATSGGRPYFADFFAGRFQIAQRRARGATADMRLFGGSFRGCPRGARPAARKPGRAVRRLWGAGSGPFRTVGRFSAATVRGTTWLTQDLCRATLTRVTVGSVSVRDFAKRRTVVVRAGRRYLAG